MAWLPADAETTHSYGVAAPRSHEEATQRLHRKLESEVTLHLQKLGEVIGGLGLSCSGSDGGDDSDEPSPESAGEEGAGKISGARVEAILGYPS